MLDARSRLRHDMHARWWLGAQVILHTFPVHGVGPVYAQRACNRNLAHVKRISLASIFVVCKCGLRRWATYMTLR